MHSNHYYWIVNMGNVAFEEKSTDDDDDSGKKEPFQIDVSSRLMALDTGMSLALIPTTDF